MQGAGGSSPAVTTLSPGGFATVFGTNFAPAGTARAVAASDFVNGALPTNLANTCVRTSGVNAFLSYVSPTQINFQVPAIAAGSLASLSVVTSCGTPDALSSQTVLVPTAAATPEFLYWVRNADGNNPVVAVNSVTGAVRGSAWIDHGCNVRAREARRLSDDLRDFVWVDESGWDAGSGRGGGPRDWRRRRR